MTFLWNSFVTAILNKNDLKMRKTFFCIPVAPFIIWSVGCSILFLVLLYVTVDVTEWKKYTLSQKQLCVSHRYVKNVTHTAVSTQVHFLHSLKKYWHEKSPQQKKWSSKQKKLKWSTFKCIYVHPELVGLIYLVWYRLYC